MAIQQSVETFFRDFSGGNASVKNPTTLKINEFLDSDNIVIKPSGSGFRNRRGNTEFNSSVMIDATTSITGLKFFKDTSANEWLVAVAGAKFFKSDSLDGTMDDVTGAITITAGVNNQWSLFNFNDLVIGVGGAPDAPFKWSGTGNAAVLGGSPPSGKTGLAWNNRAWILSDSTNPSTIYWSVVLDPEDWSGAGSGNASVQKKDGENLIAAAPISSNVLLLFKNNSTHQLVGRANPFSIFPLFPDVGCAGKHAFVVADGLCYFITPHGRMVVTDGSVILDDRNVPSLSNIDNIWDGLNSSRLEYIQGIRHRGDDYDHIIWLCSNTTSSTNNYAIVWDLKNKCWLTYSTGFEGNVIAQTGVNVMYMGGYVGKIYKMDVANTYADASNSDTNVSWFSRSDWLTNDSLQQITHVTRFNVTYKTQSSGNMTLKYGYDFVADANELSFSIQEDGSTWDGALWDTGIWGGFSDLIKPNFILGRGNVFQIALSGKDAVLYNLNRYSIFGKQTSIKHFKAS